MTLHREFEYYQRPCLAKSFYYQTYSTDVDQEIHQGRNMTLTCSLFATETLINNLFCVCLWKQTPELCRTIFDYLFMPLLEINSWIRPFLNKTLTSSNDRNNCFGRH